MTTEQLTIDALLRAGYTLDDLLQRGLAACVEELLITSDANVLSKATERPVKAPQLHRRCVSM